MWLAAFRLRAHHAPWCRIDALSQIFKPALTPPSSQGGGGDADASERTIIESEHGGVIHSREAAKDSTALAPISLRRASPKASGAITFHGGSPRRHDCADRAGRARGGESGPMPTLSSFWEWLQTASQGQATFVGALTGSFFGLLALLLGALANAGLNRGRDNRLRKEDQRVVESGT
jgi:hypothetical protein